MSIRNIRKRDGREVAFDQQKIEQAIFAAFKASGSAKGHETSALLAQQVVHQMVLVLLVNFGVIQFMLGIITLILILNGGLNVFHI